VNGVSRKHGEVSRALLAPFWPGLLEEEMPVHAITNGVHLPTWTAPEMQDLLGASNRKLETADFEHARSVAAERLWEVRAKAKARMLEDLRRRLRAASRARGEGSRRFAALERLLDPQALYLVFARRFSPYKRPALLLRDRQRLARLLSDETRPVRILYAGKAHPMDGHGQDLVRQVVQASLADDLYGRLVFVPNYALDLGARLAEGADVWLNHPIPPLEASGTSGMKAAANGGLNLSILDGWWMEGFDGENGWGVEGRREGLEPALRDDLAAATLLSLLEEEVVPAFFDRGADGIPHAWIARIRKSLVTVPRFFNTDRMVREYATRAYAPLALSYQKLSAARYAAGRALAARHRELDAAMGRVKVEATRIGDLAEAGVGDYVEAEVDLVLGELGPADVVVELVLGREDGAPQPSFHVRRLDARGAVDGGLHRYQGRARLDEPGPWVYGLRVRPREIAPWDVMLHRLVRWA
jgi:starch phosphorylase